MSRLVVTKTPKVYVGGAFIRSESGRTAPVTDASGQFFANVPQCTRKDFRNAVEVAGKAGVGWGRRTAYNRGQILYRLAEMLEARAEELAQALALGTPTEAVRAEVTAAIELVVHYAGWVDKFTQLLGSVNPVASPHFNFTVPEPVGLVAIVSPDEPALLGLLALIAPAITAGNPVIAVASQRHPYPAIVLGELLATSDLPGGVVNLLTGVRKDMVPTVATHGQVRAIWAVGDADTRKTLALGAAENVKRSRLWDVNAQPDWQLWERDSLEYLRAAVEFKTTWHPIGA